MNLLDNILESTQDVIKKYFEDYQFSLNENTIRSYKYTIKSFFNNGKEYYEIKAKDIRDWISTLQEKGQKQTTIELRIYALRHFLNYCLEENYIKKNPASNISPPKKDDKLPNYLNREELLKLKEAVKKNIRDITIVEVLYSTGIRVSELANLKIEDINLEERFLLVRNGKGKRDRIVPFTIECRERLKEYLSTRHDNYPNLFLNNWNCPITARIVRDYFKKYSKILGKRIHPHILRHTMAARLAERGMPLAGIQTLLGHEDIKNTKVYTRLYNEFRKLEYDKYL